MIASRLQPIFVTPVLLAVAFVLTVFADSGVSLDALPRPIAVAAAIALVLQLVASVILRNGRRGAVVASGAVLTLMDARLGVIVVGVAIALELWRRRGGRVLSYAPLTAFACMIFALALVRAANTPAFALNDFAFGPPDVGAATTGGPDIYLLMLDGYARSDTLAGWGYDNTWFHEELHERGFDINEESHGHYTQTSLVLPAMLQMAHVHEIPALSDVPHDTAAQKRAIQEALREAPVLKFLEDHGYWTVTAGFPRSYITLRTVDESIDDGRVEGFERQVLWRSALHWLLPPEATASQHRQRVLDSFASIERVASKDRASPTFMLSHVLSPHTPLVFDRHGNAITPACLPGCDLVQIHYERLGMLEADFGRGYAEQTHYINQLTLDAIDTIIEASPDAVVVVFSDHGTRTELNDYSEWFRTFFAARTPGHPGLFADDGRSISIFPRLFNAYFNEDVAIPADGLQFVTPDGLWPLTVEPWP